ncbi:MAG TPA: hypothetical protein DCZ05_15660 [Deltaproteobacteria bacterium]|nr:hypothetical protein [Deltaproteobacteria bacterium]
MARGSERGTRGKKKKRGDGVTDDRGGASQRDGGAFPLLRIWTEMNRGFSYKIDPGGGKA